jgi:hypothetical protein
MNVFHHRLDGFVYIQTDQGYYCDLPEKFELDLGQSYPGLPEGYGYKERIYEPGVRHVLNTGDRSDCQDLSWQLGDFYLSQYSQLITAKKIRTSPQIGG